MHPLQNQRETPRFGELDGLRGLAALVVLFSHVAGLVADPQNWSVRPGPLHLFWDGRTAVMLFFVLSGFVLSLPFTGPDGRSLEPVNFLVRRVTRLYPAYWCALLIALLLRFLVLRHNQLALLNGWAVSIWSTPLTPGLLIRQFAMVVPWVDSNGLDPVIWSLIVEMKASIIFPVIVFLVKRTPKPIYALLFIAGLALLGSDARGQSTMTIFPALQFFVGGSYLAHYRAPLLTWISQRSRLAKLALTALALLFYGNASFLGDYGRITCTIAGFGAALWILLFLSVKPLARLATVPPTRFLGSVSYSFYLLHLPILLAVTNLLYPQTHSILVCAAVALAIVLAVAKLVWLLVEMPSQNHGRWLANRATALLYSRRAPSPAVSAAD